MHDLAPRGVAPLVVVVVAREDEIDAEAIRNGWNDLVSHPQEERVASDGVGGLVKKENEPLRSGCLCLVEVRLEPAQLIAARDAVEVRVERGEVGAPPIKGVIHAVRGLGSVRREEHLAPLDPEVMVAARWIKARPRNDVAVGAEDRTVQVMSVIVVTGVHEDVGLEPADQGRDGKLLVAPVAAVPGHGNVDLAGANGRRGAEAEGLIR